MNCLINTDKIRESVISQGITLAEETGLFERTGPSSIKAVGEFTTQHQGYINGINEAYQDNLISLNENGEYDVVPSQELIAAYELKLAPEISAQTEQINNGSGKLATNSAMTRVTDFLNQIGVDVKSLESIVVDGKKINADGVALPLQSLILHTTGSDNSVVTEEAMHIGVELLSQKNPELYNQMFKNIINFPIYSQTFREYSQIKEYQTNGKPDITKIKKEAMGKLLTNVAMRSEGTKEAQSWWSKVKVWLGDLFRPMRAQMDQFKQGVESILNDNLGTVRETLLQSPEYLYEQGFNDDEISRIINMSKSMMTDNELRVAIGDVVPKLIYMKATPTVERQANKITQQEKNIASEGDQILFNGKPVSETDTTIALRKLNEKLSKTNPLYKEIENQIANNETTESHEAVADVLNKYLDSEGFPGAHDIEQLVKGKDQNYETIARAVTDKINSFPEGTKFLHGVQIADKNAAAKIDLLAVDPSEQFHLINYQEVSLKVDQRLESAEVAALQSKMETARSILARGYNVSRFGETRTMLINNALVNGKPTFTATLAKTGAMDYLAPIPTASETLGSKTLDSIYSEMYNIDRKKRVITSTKTQRELQNNKTLTSLLSSFRALQISRTVSPLANQMTNLSVLMTNLSNQYKEQIKGKNLNHSDPVVKQFTEDMAVYLNIADTLKRVQDGVAEIKAAHPESIEKYEIAQLGRATRELNEAFSDLNLQANDLVDSYIAKPRGIRDINEPELIQSWMSRNFRTSSMSSQASVQLLHKITSEGQHRAELRQNDFLKSLKTMKDSYTKFMKAKGISNNKALDLVTQKDDKGNYIHRLVEKVSRDFYDQAKVALQNKDMQWIKDNVDRVGYDKWFEAQKEEQFNFIESQTFNREDESIEELRGKYKEEWLDRFDLDRGLNEANTKIYNFPQEDKFVSEGYKKLTEKGNEPALALYNMILDLNTKAVEAGVLDEYVAKTFIPFRNKSTVGDAIFGRGQTRDNAIKEFFKPQAEFYSYGDYQPDSSSKRRIPFNLIQDVSKRHINEKGEVVVDYSGVSKDIFDLLAAYNYQTEVYTNYSDVEAASQLLIGAEKTKGSKATDKTSGNAIEGGGIVENVHNLATLEQFVMAEVYGKKYDDMDINGVITLNMNAAKTMMNNKFGTNFDTSSKGMKVPVKELLDVTRNFFIFKTLGFNPATALVNLLGTHMQASVDAGQFFTKSEFIKNNFKVFSEALMGYMSKAEKTKLLGAIDYFIPLVDNETNQSHERGMKLSTLSKLDLGHSMMSMLRASDVPVQWAVAASYLSNTILENGELVNTREYLRGQDKYLKMYEATEEERKALKTQFEADVTKLNSEKGLINQIEFDKDGIAQIPGLARDSDTVVNLRERLQQLSKNATGMGTNNEYRMFNSTVIGRNLMTFFSWAPRLIDKRYQSLRYVTALDQVEWGRLRTFANWVQKGISETGVSVFNLSNDAGINSLKQEFQKQVEQYEANTGKHYFERGANEEFNRQAAERDFIDMYQRNIKAQMKEFKLLVGMFGVLLLAINAAPDDEESKGITKYASKVARKVLGEINFFYNPMSILDLTNGKVFPGAAVIKDSQKFFKDLYLQLFGDEEAQEKARPLGRAIKMTPGLAQIAPMIAIFDQDMAKELDYQLPAVSISEPNH